MAKRFGRNQKRILLAEIAKMQDTIDNLRGVVYQPATGIYPALTSLGTIIEQSVTDDRSSRRITRKARILLWLGGAPDPDQALYDLSRNFHRSCVEWDGLVWILDAIDHDAFRGLRNADTIEVELTALGKKSARITPSFETRHLQVGYSNNIPTKWERTFYAAR